MNEIEQTSEALFFTPGTFFQNRKISDKKEKKVKKSGFKTIFEKNATQAQFASEGLPVEIATMEIEEAVIYLKDALDLAGDALKKRSGMAEVEKYRVAISQFLKYVSRNNFEVLKHERRGFARNGKMLSPQIEIQVINQKLDNLVRDVLYNHAGKLKILAEVDELKGLIVDLLAG